MPFNFRNNYFDGGQRATYEANFGGDPGGSLGSGGNASLQGQLNAMSSFDPSVMLNALLRAQADQQRYGMERRDWERSRDRRDAFSDQGRQQMERFGFGSSRDPLAGAGQQAQLAQMQALSRPVPSRMTNFPSGANNWPVADEMRMTGAQRQMFLPGNSTMQGQVEPQYRAALSGYGSFGRG